MRVASCLGPNKRKQKFTSVKFVISSRDSSFEEGEEEEEERIPMIPKKDKRRTIRRPVTQREWVNKRASLGLRETRLNKRHIFGKNVNLEIDVRSNMY